MFEDETYLGDAVYASFTGEMIRLRCEAPSEANVIYLEREVFANLLRFMARISSGEVSA